MTEEEPLIGGREHQSEVVRIGDTVRGPTGPWTPTVHTSLDWLAANAVRFRRALDRTSG
jgi:hypothetical protein